MTGPYTMLDVATSQALAMVLHELATNAAKYGALSSPHGRVEVKWTCAPAEAPTDLSLVWREVGGPAVAAPPESRYGVSLIHDLIPRELGGSVDLVFASTGICCTIGMPLKARPASRRQA
jgi:two-component sensor histidine kinase